MTTIDDYPTRAVARMISNNQGYVQSLEGRLEDRAEQLWIGGGKDIRRIVDEALDQIATWLLEEYELATEDLEGPFDSLAQWALDHVDWREVVDSVFIDETAYRIVAHIVEQMEEV